MKSIFGDLWRPLHSLCSAAIHLSIGWDSREKAPQKTNLEQFFELPFFNGYGAPNILDKALEHEGIFVVFYEVLHFRNLSDMKKKPQAVLLTFFESSESEKEWIRRRRKVRKIRLLTKLSPEYVSRWETRYARASGQRFQSSLVCPEKL